MTEQEWLTSEEPAAMLRALQDGSLVAGDGLLLAPPDETWPGDRKLRLFACAMTRRMVSTDEGRSHIDHITDLADDPDVDWHRLDLPFPGSGYWCADPDVCVGVGELLRTGYAEKAGAELAALLREVVGNPFRRYAWSAIHDASPSGHELQFLGERWRTPTVLSLAQAAYDRHRCEHCMGPGGERLHYTGKIQHEPCPECGRGAFWTGDDTTLDPFRLALVADALEEAGCDGEVLLRHLRGWTTCPRCMGVGRATILGDPDHRACSCVCNTPHGSPTAGLVRAGPHVRGCWAIDLILGKS